jgi:hypothetical protein
MRNPFLIVLTNVNRSLSSALPFGGFAVFARLWISFLLVLAVLLSGCGGSGSQKDVQKLQEEAGPNYIEKMNMGEDDPPGASNASP